MNESPIASRLVEDGLLTEELLAQATQTSIETEHPLLRVLVDDGYVDEADLFMVAADVAGMPFVDPNALMVDPEVSRLLSGPRARRYRALPFARHAGTLMVAISDPTNLALRDDLSRSAGCPVTFCLSPPTALSAKISQVYRSDAEIGYLSQEIISEMAVTQDDELTMYDTPGPVQEDDAPTVRFVDLLVTQAVHDRASDIHIEPGAEDVQIRYRVDGILVEQSRVSRSILSGVVSRLKVMGGMDISEKRAPQDGRATVLVDGRKVDIRMIVLPTVWGEKVVLRLLDQATGLLNLSKLGMSPSNLERYRTQYKQPNGLILVTGPTGSGKSTTLYSTLAEIQSQEINAVTVEDPVEFRLPGITQIQVAPKTGVTFASSLRSILRADPDVILVGEIRDRETAQIAIEAALTGHLVLSSMHTNDAPSAATRLIEMGVEPFLVGAALRSVVAQRLVRRLCRCKEEYALTAEELDALGIDWDDAETPPSVYRPKGCPYCNGTGYRGRVPIHEVMVVSPEIERLINENGHSDRIRLAAIEDGLRPMKHDGWSKAFAGVTSIEEVLRVLG